MRWIGWLAALAGGFAVLAFLLVPAERALEALGVWGFGQATKQTTFPDSVTVTASSAGCHWRYSYGSARASFDPGATPCAGAVCTMGLDPDRAAPIPAGERIHLYSTSQDEIRVLAVPPLGLQVDAVPGRLNEVWVEAKVEGVFTARQGADCVGKPGAIPAAFRAMERRSFDAGLAGHRDP